MSFPCCSFRECPPLSFVLLVLTTWVNSAILTILQIDGAAEDPITRFSALSSLLCASMSLLFGCMYIIRFGTMRKTYKAAEWALVCTKSTRACRCKHSRFVDHIPRRRRGQKPLYGGTSGYCSQCQSFGSHGPSSSTLFVSCLLFGGLALRMPPHPIHYRRRACW